MSTIPMAPIVDDRSSRAGADQLRHRPGQVRRATTGADFGAATALLTEYIRWIERSTSVVVFAAQPEFALEIADLERAYAAETSALFVADGDGTVRGTLAVRIDAGAAEVKRMYVEPGSRGQGHAGRLLRTALGWARGAGASSAWLETLPGVMDPAIDLYRRHGFRPADICAGVGIDAAIVMTLDLRRVTVP